MWRAKNVYLAVYGLAPHFQQFLVQKLKGSDYVAMFDESVNVHMQSKQLDIPVRIWDVNRVTTRYYTSHFLGHADASTVLDKLLDSCSTLGLSGMQQKVHG